MTKFTRSYDVCVIDIGSPRLGNLGWCFIEVASSKEHSGADINDIFTLVANSLKSHGLILGLEAPLFVPLRKDLMLATKARNGEKRKPWSAGAGAQVLAMNLPIMIYILNGIKKICPDASFFVNEEGFEAKPNQVMIFEALVSGADKGNSHINDAQIMARKCIQYSKETRLPNSILLPEAETDFLNLTAAALLRCGFSNNLELLNAESPIYKP